MTSDGELSWGREELREEKLGSLKEQKKVKIVSECRMRLI